MSEVEGKAKASTAKEHVPTYAWVILVIVYLGSIATTFNFYKVGAIMPVIIQQLGITATSGGLLMSVISLVGIFIALPAGIIVKKMGLKTLGIVALTFLVIGNLIAGFTATYQLLLFGRVFEGVARALIAVVGPAAMAIWFPQSRRGIATGILSTWVGVGQFITFNTAASITAQTGRYQTVFVYGAIAAAVGLVLYAIFYKNQTAAQSKSAESSAAGEEANPTIGEVLKNKNIWFLAIMFMCFTAVIVATASFYPAYLRGTGIDLVLAGRVTSLFAFAPIVLGPLFGILSDKIGSRKKIYTFGMVLGIIASVFMYNTGAGAVWPWIWMLVVGITCGAVSSVALACPPEVVGRRAAALGVGVMITGNQIGGFASPLILGAARDATGSFVMGGYIIAVLLVVGLISGLMVKVR
jgi:MFS family permease